MPIQKIKSGRVITVTSDNFVGEHGMIFYDEILGDLRLGDGHTPGGRVLTFGSGGTGTYVLPVASATSLGGIKVGDYLTIDADGVLSVNTASIYVLPAATTSTLGGIKVGANLTVTEDGTLNANTSTVGVSDTFKTIVASSGSNIVASGEDILSFIAGAGMKITANPSASPYKSLTFDIIGYGNFDGGAPDSVYGGVPSIDGGSP